MNMATPVKACGATGSVQADASNEWDRLRSVIVGSAEGAQVPRVRDRALHAIDYPHATPEEFASLPAGPYPRAVIEETAEDLEAFSAQLTGLGIEVHRPRLLDFSERYSTRLWSVDGYYTCCPRDTITVIGRRVYAAPMVLRHRQAESRAYRGLFPEAAWVQCPLPALPDEMYLPPDPSGRTLAEVEPAFDAANIMRFDRDILYLVSNTGNRLGAGLLQELLGSGYRVHVAADVYNDRHIDTTFVPLREGLLMCNPSRVRDGDIPDFLRGWDILRSPEMVPLPALDDWGPASEWIGMNVLSISPSLVAVEEHQTPLMKAFRSHGIESLPVRLRHTRTIGGGPHCVTADLVRG